MKGEPEAPVRPDLQVLIGELLGIDIWQSGEAAEDFPKIKNYVPIPKLSPIFGIIFQKYHHVLGI